MSNDEVNIEGLAVAKVLMHQAKHPHANVSGILIGPSSTGKGTISIEDAIPLFHHTTLNPLLETAFLLVEQYAKKAGKQIVGYYYALAQVNQPDAPASSAIAIAENIQSNLSQEGGGGRAVIIRVNSKKLAEPKESPLEAFLRDGQGSWSLQSAASVSLGQAGLTAFDRGGYEACRDLVDMDDHLDDVKKDFRNPQIASLLR